MKTEQQLRTEIKSLVGEYFEVAHRPKLEAPFVAGETRVNYAGRMFGAEEMLNLVDSSLDFWLTSGRYCDQFERSFSQKLGVKYTALVNSGSSANLVAFYSLTSPLLKDRRIRKGDEVITVAAGFPTTVAPIIQFGAVPVFVDVKVDDGTYNIDVTQLEAARTDRTKAVMVAHTLGNPFDLDAVKAFCEKHELWLVEDNCDALGSTYKGKLTGTFGDIATSSFYPPHHLTMGEGGAVYTSKPLLKRSVESFRDWGRDCWCPSGKDNTCNKRFGWKLGQLPEGYDHKYIYRHLGFNLKVTDMQAAIGCAQLERLDSFTEARRSNWLRLREGLSNLKDQLVLPEPTEGASPSWFGFAMTVRESASFTRNEICEYLEENKIQTRMLFGGNLLRHPAFDELRDQPGALRVVGELPQTDRIMMNTFWVGVYPGMIPNKLDYIIDKIQSFARK
ncbi:MAG: lipopolysaccharide biosynthesis protein RfbH [Bdellovibrionales bacterium CG10_big_fil_rev_8_21_14_0_10_45_34]|nr:MAG: lipopolysaccharide biosynthesis protein RfbH [Bdellovibrionales bacterium CG10_big_fil_rev_8_21_14_0_10_45_34]